MKKTLLEQMEEDGTPIDTSDIPEQGAAAFARATLNKHRANVRSPATNDPRRYPVKGEPKTHQIRALAEAHGRPGHCYWMDPGAGKTFTCIAEAGLLYEMGLIDGVLIFAPMGPHEQWIDEQFPLWADYPWQGAHNKLSPGKLKKFFEDKQKGLGVLSINYDSLRTANGFLLIDKFFAKYPRTYLIIDESQKIKTPKAQRTLESLRWSLRASYRRLLSGTPILKGLEDLWSQYEAAQPGLAWPHQPVALTNRGVSTPGYFGYRSHYCKMAPVPGNPRAQRIVGYRNEEELRERTSPYATRIMADEFMKGETPDFMTVRTPMSGNQKVQYRLMKEHLLAQIDSGTLTASNALTQMQKLLQIASGFIYNEEKQAEELGSNKIDAAMEIIEQLSEPVIVWSPFIHLSSMMVQRLHNEGLTDRIFTGIDDVEYWKRCPDGILVGNQTSGLGVGMNLQHAAANIYLANSFSSEARRQSVKRTDRIGQTRQVRIWDLITPDTVDVKTIEALNAKEEISRRNIDGLREMLG